jgi:hypothetical protein
MEARRTVDEAEGGRRLGLTRVGGCGGGWLEGAGFLQAAGEFEDPATSLSSSEIATELTLLEWLSSVYSVALHFACTLSFLQIQEGI